MERLFYIKQLHIQILGAADVLGKEVPMARPRSKQRDDLVISAMRVFWRQGFRSTSMADLVKATGVSRGGIYADFGGKEDLFLTCLGAYRERYIEPALKLLTEEADGFSAIESYFDFFIELHRRHGMPGPGCFFANAMTEQAPHNPRVGADVNQHMNDLQTAFLTALDRCSRAHAADISDVDRKELARFLATASQGLWSYGRSTTNLDELISFKSALLKLLRARLDAVSA
jgi:TetR/AcrR family transcriptional repressor of nem operon